MSLIETIRSKTEYENDCWLWIGRLNDKGYGKIYIKGTGNRFVHRVAYEILVGPVSEELQLDHLCHTRNCWNPEHLDPVTNLENSRRALVKTHCLRGHELSDDNLYFSASGRHCRKCAKIRSQEQRLRNEIHV